jgi:glycosyltransferase involved in cell wall biosynthesis
MPLVLLEALAMGLPVVATDIPGIRDLVADGRNGFLVPPGDPAAMRAALLRITADPDGYQRMSAESRRVAGQYSWDRIGAEFERLYAEAGARAADGNGGRRGRAGGRGVQR